MTKPRSAPRRATETMQEASRLARTLAMTLGGDVRASRRRLGLQQRELARRVGVHQSRVSQIERGRGTRAPFGTWIALGVALERPFVAAFSRPLGAGFEARDAGHLELQEFLLALAARTGRRATFELATRPSDSRRSVDVGVRDDALRLLILEECWNTIGDLGDAVRSTKRKLAEVDQLAAAMGGARPYRIAGVWVVRDSAANRTLLGRYPRILADAFPGSSRQWVRCLIEGGTPPRGPGLVWIDPRTSRITEWRRPRPVLG